ncbi:tRNA dimethylallyltransferase 2 isoform X1 [Ziziphus jujuba]|uniref:tRNA dimethylallyltransferase 2 isoform X1 n=1 Tax=Ziziphus jujuba TaxID=326968 RepID=A0A6P3ZEL1_ZIZJJ|nr:tRNA dimethylallyltransferase 2 isoform X1 [Ziziphus jujuba]
MERDNLSDTGTQRTQFNEIGEEKPKIVVIMGPTGSGKSKLAVDLGSHFPIEVVNADSMQVYHGLDVLTNKVPLPEQKGVPHHLLGTVSPNVEFTAKEFRDSAIPIINDILSRNCLPVIVGGTNYYIQALVSPFLLDDTAENTDEDYSSNPSGDGDPCHGMEFEDGKTSHSYEHLKDIDPVAANRVHPNNHRKIRQYLSLYTHTGVLPSKLLQGKAAENWGQVDNFRYDCCFVSMDASLPVLDRYVEERVDCMVGSGLLNEVYDIFNPNADYTRGLRQAIGVREFESFLTTIDAPSGTTDGSASLKTVNSGDKILKEHTREMLNSSDDNQHKILLSEAIENVKLNTRRLVRRQKRRLLRLHTLFGWDIHFVDATESIQSKSDDIWSKQVVEPAVKIIRSFLSHDANSVSDDVPSDTGTKILARDLWTQYVCEACGNRVLRGAHEWEQHIQGRGHRKRMSHLRKSRGFSRTDQQGQQQTLSSLG